MTTTKKPIRKHSEIEKASVRRAERLAESTYRMYRLIEELAKEDCLLPQSCVQADARAIVAFVEGETL